MNDVQPEPYMDEIFHVPQAQNYCHGNYHHWNDKITTLPGLYFASHFLLALLAKIVSYDVQSICTTINLRLINLLFLFGCIYIMKAILKATQKVESKSASNERDSKENSGTASKERESAEDDIRSNNIFLSALVLGFFPLLFFNSLIYYTDVGSTFFVLLTYLFGLQDQHYMASVTGALAIFFRQTNVVWVGFTAATSVLKQLPDINIYTSDWSQLFTDIKMFIWTLFSRFVRILLVLFPYLMVLLGFVVFVVKNGSIVVGDKSSHKACLNFPQLLYFTAFTMCFSAFTMLRHISSQSKLKKAICWIISIKGMMVLIIMSIVCFVMVAQFTYVHEYLISDNRHYTFYVWKKIFERHWSIRYALIPGYVFASIMILGLLSETQSQLWITLFVICTCAVTVPQKLLEFRYYIVPYIIYRLNINIGCKAELFGEALLYFVVNSVTIYLYTYQPFSWSHEPEVIQRFMW